MNNKKGNSIAIVIIAVGAIALVIASVVGLIATQRRIAVMRELQLQANNVAESSIDYAFAYAALDVKKLGIDKTAYVPTTGHFPFDFSSDNAISQKFLAGAITADPAYTLPTSQVTFSDLAVSILPALPKVSYTVSATENSVPLAPFRNQVVVETAIPLVAKVTATAGKFSYTTFIRKDIAVRSVALFQKSIFWEQQLHMHRGFPILGPVHSNSNLVLNAQSGDLATYIGQVTCAGRFYRGSAFDVGGTGADAYGYCTILPKVSVNDPDVFDFTYALNYSGAYIANEKIKLVATGPDALKIATVKFDNTNNPPTAFVPNNFDSRLAGWQATAVATFKNNLLDAAHSVPILTPPGVDHYTLDSPTTKTVNEFNNGTYGLIEPSVPSTHECFKADNIYQFARKCSLLFRVELLADLPKTPTSNVYGRTLDTRDTRNWIVKAYLHTEDDTGLTNILTPLPMPSGIIGPTQIATSATANDQYKIASPTTDPTGVVGGTCLYKKKGATGDVDYLPSSGSGATKQFARLEGLFEEFMMDTTLKQIKNMDASSTSTKPAAGYFDCRMGRGVSPVTINMKRLKQVLEQTTYATYAEERFKELVTASFNGLVYVEFPTSLKALTGTDSPYYDKDTNPSGHTPRPVNPKDPVAGTEFIYFDANADGKLEGDVTAVDSYCFAYGEKELRHPDRWLDTDSEVNKRVDRDDKILPIAPGLRGYPATFTDAEIMKGEWAIPALQIVNAQSLPNVMNPKDTTKPLGFTVSTNAPIYLVGSYNADGLASTGTNIRANPPRYAVVDTDTDPSSGAPGNQPEVSAGLFCEYFTILSNQWKDFRFTKSFSGEGAASNADRKVTSGRLEISACLLTAEYPIFEFYIHALENWYTYYSPNNANSDRSPFIIKGAVAGLFHSEIQHIKQAYKRDKTRDIQVYYEGHGAFAIGAVRFHKFLADGTFPPGTPYVRAYNQASFTLLQQDTDKAILQQAGFLSP